MTSLVALALLVAAADPPVLVGPHEELAAAVADLAGVPAGERRYVRYLSLYALPVENRSSAAAGVSLVLGAVSRARTIARPEVVPGTKGRLLRISLSRYALPPQAWEAILAAEPYWHLRTKVVDPATGKTKEVYTDGGWIDLAAAARLRNMSTSGGALVRADWFVSKAATTLDGGVYYQLAGVPEKEVDYFKQLGIDTDAIGRLAADEGANLLYSNVTRQVRRIIRRQGPLGGAWETLDVEKSTAQRDPFRNPLAFRYDAGEHIAAKANGLHLFALYDSQGRRADSVPDKIARDTSDPHGDGIIAPMISCVRCHREDGLRPFVNDQRRLLAGRVELFAQRPEVAERLAAFYATDLGKRLRRDREDYAQAVRAATGGMTVDKAADALAAVFRGYVYTRVTPGAAARELGIPLPRMQRRLSISHDPILLALCQGIPVQRKQWEASFAEAATLARRAPPTPAKNKGNH